MWTYSQSAGRLFHDGIFMGLGYSGAEPDGKNNPDLQNVPDVGPIPQGSYAIGEPFSSSVHGPFAMPLTPDPTNEMFGRAGFLMHGDAIEHPGCASEGCIILPHAVREAVWNSGDHDLEVTA